MNGPEDTGFRDTVAVIEAFGGIRPMAHKLDVPVSTVQGWKQRNVIPQNRVADILAAAQTHNVNLTGIAAVEDEPIASDSDESDPDEMSPDSVIASPTASSGQAPRHNGRGAFLLAVIALIVAVATAGWLVMGGGGEQSADFSDIVGRLKALETAPKSAETDGSQQQFAADISDLRAQIDRIAKAQRESTLPTTEIDDIAARLQAAETRFDQAQRKSVSEVQAAVAALSASQAEIEQLRQRLSTLSDSRASSGQDVAGAVGLALAAGTLQRTMDQGGAYDEVLAALRTHAAGDAEIAAVLDQLAGRAGTGIPTRDALAQAFPGIARAAVAAGVEAADGWTDRTLQRIRNTVSIRRIGSDVPGDAPDARIARAEVKLSSGDLAGAVGELAGLEGAAAAAAAPWLDDAKARLGAETAVDRLESLAIARLQADGGGS